jgi:hypothetical protein
VNKTLLLIICDFLLLNLLALTNWERAEPVRPPGKPLPSVRASDASSKDDDLVSVMKLSLEDEQARRDQLSQQLQSAQTTLQQREQNLSQVSSTLAETQKSAADLSQKYAAAAQDATLTKEQLAKLQRDLEARQAETARQKEQLAALEKQQAEAREKIENLNVAVKVSEQEKQLLRATADSLKTQVEAERQDRLKVQETTTQLAQGVGHLAENSSALTKEIRENRPINLNVLFNDFLANRVLTTFAASRPGLFGSINRGKQSRTVFVTDGKETVALLHIDDTPFTLGEIGWDWNTLRADFSKSGYQASAPALSFLAVDPRVAVLPVTPKQVAALGVKPYQIALEPFKFPDAVLISNGGAGYGEVPFKLDPTNPSYVRMDNRLVRRLFGDFAPSRGDLVLSKTGELLGIMVNSDYCALVTNFLPAQTIRTGDDLATRPTGDQFTDLIKRLHRLPMRLQ